MIEETAKQQAAKIRLAAGMVGVSLTQSKKKNAVNLRGVSVKRIAELFKNSRTENRLLPPCERTEMRDTDIELMKSFRKRHDSASDSSIESDAHKSQDSSQKRIRSNVCFGMPVKVRKRPIAVSLKTSTNNLELSKKSFDWKTVDDLDLGPEDTDQVDKLVQGSLFFKNKDAFNLTDKHKMYFKLKNKDEQSQGKSNEPTICNETAKENSRLSSRISIACSLKNLRPKDISHQRVSIPACSDASNKTSKPNFMRTLRPSPTIVAKFGVPSPLATQTHEVPQESQPIRSNSKFQHLRLSSRINFSKPIKGANLGQDKEQMME